MDESQHTETKQRRFQRISLRDLFEQRNMSTGQDSDHLDETEISQLPNDDSEISNLNTSGSSQFDNPRLEQRRVRIEDSQGDFGNRNGTSNWNYARDLISAQHRTTSIHRNIRQKQNAPTRSIPRNLEERRKWISEAATLNRQPLLEHAQKILEYMEQDSSLMTNDPDGEILRREALKNMPQSLAVKKMIKRKFVNSVSSKTKTIGCGKMLKYQISIWFSHIKNGIKNFMYSAELWYSSLKEIEGNFGSGVSTYFKFLRRVFVLNLMMIFFCMCFVVIPQIIFTINQVGTNVTVIENEETFSVKDLFLGTGYLTDTVLYYGFYTTGRINYIYSMPDAYFYTMVCLFIANTIILGISMAKSYRKSFIETMGGLQNVFAHKIFCGWDYGIAKSEAANLRSSAIYTELKELLSDYMKSKVKFGCLQKVMILTLQLTGHLFVLTLVGATGYLTWILLDAHRTQNYDDESDGNRAAVLTAVIINIVMIVFPMLFRLIGSYEGYKSPRMRVIVTFLRTLTLELVVIGILIVFWLTHSSNQSCWENSLGQEIYRLIIFDFFFSVIFTSCFDVARFYIHKKFKQMAAPEFDIAGNTFSVIYNQTLFWLGLFFTPLLGVVIILKLFLTWYVRSWILLRFCVPPKKSWRAAQTETLFLIITFLSSLLLLFTHGYILINIPTSHSCGPFRYVDYMHLIFINAAANLDTGNQFLVFLNFIRKPGVIALVLIAISMVVYYLRSKSIAQQDFVSFLRGRLILAAQDKEFLLRHISELANADWHKQISQQREVASNPSTLPPNIPKAIRLAEYGEMLPGSSSDDLLTTASTTSFPFSDSSISEYVNLKPGN